MQDVLTLICGRSLRIYSVYKPKLIPYFLLESRSETAPSLTENLKILREDIDFRRHIVNVALQKIQQVQEKGACDGAEGGDKNKVLQHLITLAK